MALNNQQWLICHKTKSNQSLSATQWICIYGLKHGFGIYGFRPTWPCPIIEVLPARVKFLESSSYCTVINCTFTFHTRIFLISATVLWLSISSWIKLCCMFIYTAYKSHTECSNTQHVSTPTNTILPTTAGNFHSLRCFGHIIYTLQTSTHENIVKSLTPVFFTAPETKQKE